MAKIGEGLLDKPEDVLMERAYCIQPQEMGGSKDCIEMGHGRIGG